MGISHCPGHPGRLLGRRGAWWHQVCTLMGISHCAWQFALPVASGAAALFFILADRHGKKDSRCIVRVPLLIAGFWSIVAILSIYTIVRPLLGR